MAVSNCMPRLHTRRLALHLTVLLLAALATGRPAAAQTLTSFSVNPTSIAVNTNATGTVTMTGAPNGTFVCLSSSNACVSIPSSVSVNGGIGTFTIHGVSPGTATLVASYGSTSLTATITVTGMGGGGGGGGGGFLYQVVDIPVQASITNLALTDIFMPDTMKISWSSPFRGACTYAVMRDGTVLGNTSNLFYIDTPTCGITSGTGHTYSVQIVSGKDDLGLPPPPQGANPNTIAHLTYQSTPGPWVSINVTPYKVVPSDNQTVDSRYDLRYSTYVYKNFQFGTKVYRGGLFAGYGADNSNVGRSFLQWSLPTLSSGQALWIAGTLNLYYTRSLKQGSMTVGLQPVAGGWSASTLVWTNAPSLTPTGAQQTLSVNYDGTNASAKWCNFHSLGDILMALSNGGSLSEGLASTNESTTAWAYFAKKEWNGGAYAPYVLYAIGNMLQLTAIVLVPSTVKGGNSVSGTVLLNGPAPMGGVVVYLTSSDPAHALVSACPVLIPQGAMGASFTVTTSSVSSNTNVTITGTGFGSASATLTVTP